MTDIRTARIAAELSQKVNRVFSSQEGREVLAWIQSNSGMWATWLQQNNTGVSLEYTRGRADLAMEITHMVELGPEEYQQMLRTAKKMNEDFNDRDTSRNY